jgi:nucleoside-diphosphate-sugar epimerase
VTFVRGDIGDQQLVEDTLRGHKVDVVVNFAAESHNSYAIVNPGAFFATNVTGTQQLLEAARRVGLDRFHHVSTCEVYGDMDLDDPGAFDEDSPYRPRTPHNASKAGGDHAVRAYHLTYDLPVTITNCSNNYGPYQFPEKSHAGVRHQRPARDQAPGVRVVAEPAGVALRRRPRHRHRRRPRPRPGRRDLPRRLRVRSQRADHRRHRPRRTRTPRLHDRDRPGPALGRPPLPPRLHQTPHQARLDPADPVGGRHQGHRRWYAANQHWWRPLLDRRPVHEGAATDWHTG